ncbi:MAG TPA: Trp biosynthesis-associated membrane protein [Actinophytocola sp.]|uniref:Trp biosynthesis-associated membrane protein n=1 Tax=Actinophytocola sp. TaxID=1872138 RepID=UPI002DDD61A7|nr:Trp biosynthesis-associated membrane protein [Actinophytocola sp.]HEV2784011.1 Trp biosynthesis-associated membrane protein [Actinophytocola sp.]
MLKRPLWIVTGALLAGALGLWVSSRLTWGTSRLQHPGTDATTVVLTHGAGVAPLVPLAVVALAGIAAAVALSGWPRRILGVLLAGAGLAAVAMGVFADATVTTDFVPWGRILGVAAGVLIVLAGVLLVWRGGRLPRLGATYEVPGATRREDDRDGDLWQALSQGKDPTTDEP